MSSISDTSDSEDLFQKDETLVPSGMSMDDLLHSREAEKGTPIQDEPIKAIEVDSIPEFENPCEIIKKTSIDGTVFSDEDTEFPKVVFQYLKIEPDDSEITIRMLEKWEFIALTEFFDFCSASPEIYFAFCGQVIENGTADLGIKLVKYGKKLPEHCIDYRLWLKLFTICLEKNIKMACYILGSVSLKSFIIESEEMELFILFDIFLFHTASIMTQSIVSQRGSFYMVDTFQALVSNEKLISLPEIQTELSDVLYVLLEKSSMACIGNISIYFPNNDAGSSILINTCPKLIYNIVDYEETEFESVSVYDVPMMLKHIRKMCAEKPVSASAVIALVNVVVTAGIKAGEIDADVIHGVNDSLMFTIPCTDPSDLTMLKEQIHITRSQLDILARHTHVIASQQFD